MEKQIILGAGMSGQSRMLEHILAEQGKTMDDVIVINIQETSKDEALEIFKNAPEGKLILIEDVNLLMDKPPVQEVMKLHNTYSKLEDEKWQYAVDINKPSHPFAKFMGKGKKNRGRW